MIYIKTADSIDVAKLSTRSSNALHRAKIHTIADLLAFDPEKIGAIRHLGTKSTNEILSFLNTLNSGEGEFRLATKLSMKAEDNTSQIVYEQISLDQIGPEQITTEQVYIKPDVLFRDDKNRLCKDIPIERLNLSAKSYKCLKNARFNYASQLIGITYEMLKPIKYLDKKGINEILEKAAALSFITLVKDTPRTKAEVLCEGFVLKLKEILPIHAGIVYIELLPFFKRSVKKRMKFSNRFFFSFTHLRNAVKQKIASYLSESPFGINKSDLLNLFPNGFMDITLLELIIKEMELDNQVIIGNRIELRRMTILEYAQNIPNDKERRILLSRLHGMTLDEIGKQHKVTRERIRQIVVKCLRNKPAVFEDKYIPLFNKYNFSLKDFISIFNEENFVYNYLTITSTQHGELPLNKLLNDETVNDEIKKCVERVI